MVKTTTYIEGQFAAAHVGPYAETVHGHDWFVRVYFDASRHSAIDLMEALDRTLELLDHKCIDDILGADMATNEKLAVFFLSYLSVRGAAKVEVWRFHKMRRFGAVAE